MALTQQLKVNPADLDPALPDGAMDVEVKTRLKEVRFPFPSSENLVFVFEPLVGTRSQGDITIHLQTKMQPALPEMAIEDPDGNEVVAAGSERPMIPSVDQLRAMGLPDGAETVNTIGELLDLCRKTIYQSAISLNPNWNGAVED